MRPPGGPGPVPSGRHDGLSQGLRDPRTRAQRSQKQLRWQQRDDRENPGFGAAHLPAPELPRALPRAEPLLRCCSGDAEPETRLQILVLPLYLRTLDKSLVALLFHPNNVKTPSYLTGLPEHTMST